MTPTPLEFVLDVAAKALGPFFAAVLIASTLAAIKAWHVSAILTEIDSHLCRGTAALRSCREVEALEVFGQSLGKMNEALLASREQMQHGLKLNSSGLSRLAKISTEISQISNEIASDPHRAAASFAFEEKRPNPIERRLGSIRHQIDEAKEHIDFLAFLIPV
jgi:hypothetical protein